MMLKVSETVSEELCGESELASCQGRVHVEVDKFLPCKARRGEGVGVGAKAMLRCLAQVSANWTHGERPVAIPVED